MNKITVLISDEHALFRQGLRVVLEAAEDIEVIGETRSSRAAVWEAKRLQPDFVVMDLALPLVNGVEAARRIAREVPTSKVFIFSAYSDDLEQQAVEAGAAGYLTKETSSEDLLLSIRNACNANALSSAPIARRSSKPRRSRALQSKSAVAPELTDRQTEVVQLIAEGCSNREIACVLSLSSKTVEKHRQAAMDKLDIHNIASLTRYAVSSGVVKLKPYVQLTRDHPIERQPRIALNSNGAGRGRTENQFAP